MTGNNAVNLSKQSWWLLVLSSFSVALIFLIQGHQGLDLADEGFLWYGAQRVLLGEFPLLDFMSYDPGRYFWSSAFMHLIGSNGVIALRIAIGAFQLIGLYLSLSLICRGRDGKQLLFVFLTVLTLLAWMIPRHKLFDITLSIVFVYFFSLLIAKPKRPQLLAAGIVVGVAAMFGRNHGLYGLLSGIGCLVYLAVGHGRVPLFTTAKTFATGVLLGYSPMLLLFLMIPGYFDAFWATILLLFQQRATNLPIPLPWPWQAIAHGISTDALKVLLTGLFFISIPLFGLWGIVQSVIRKLQSRLFDSRITAAAFVSLPYAHFAFSRADLNHIAQSIFPFLIGLILLFSKTRELTKIFLILILCSASLFLMLDKQPGWTCIKLTYCVEKQVAGDRLRVSETVASELTLFEGLAAEYADEDRSFYAAPHWPGIYAALQRKSPTWEIYSLVTRDENFQMQEFEKIERSNPAFLVIKNYTIDDRGGSRFQVTNPLLYAEIVNSYELITSDSENTPYKIFINH